MGPVQCKSVLSFRIFSDDSSRLPVFFPVTVISFHLTPVMLLHILMHHFLLCDILSSDTSNAANVHIFLCTNNDYFPFMSFAHYLRGFSFFQCYAIGSWCSMCAVHWQNKAKNTIGPIDHDATG